MTGRRRVDGEALALLLTALYVTALAVYIAMTWLRQP